jgi:hypothetical protein
VYINKYIKGIRDMHLPQQIEFMSQKWSIRTARYKELDNCLGQCDPTTNTIIIDPDLPDDVMLQTLFHEIIHSWEITLCQNLTEQQVDVLSTAMIHCFKQNPELLLLLSQEENYDTFE